MIRKYTKFYMALMKFGVSLKMVYSLNFWLNCISDIVNYSVHMLIFFTIFHNVDAINGWSLYQVTFYLGTFFLVDSMVMVTYFFGVNSIPEYVRTGALDLFITKPINTLFYVSLNRFEPSFAPNLIYGLAIIIYSLKNMQVTVTIAGVLGYISLFTLMVCLYFTIMVIINSASFWFVKIDSIHELNSQLFNFSYKVPGIMYKGVWKMIFLVILPYGLIATVPTQFATDVFTGQYWGVTLAVALTYWIVCILAWSNGLKRYNSASS